MSVILGSNASSHSRSLLSHLHRLLNIQSSTPDHLLDTVLYCRDGTVKWNRFMLASNSSLLASCEDVFEAILLPDVTVSTVTSMLRCTVNPTVRNDTLSVNELEVMRLLGFTKLPKHNNTNQEKSQPQQKVAPDNSYETGSSKMQKISEATMVSTVPNNKQPSLLGITKVTDDHIPSDDKKRNSTSKKVIECNFVGCGLTFTRQLHLERHKASHTNDQDFICEHCGKLFHHQDNLALHMSYHEDILRPVQCSECHVVCQGKRSLKSHMDSSHVAKVQCNKCGRYLRERLLKKHILKKHRGGEEDLNSRVFCHLCGKDFSNGQALMTHKRSHNQNNGYLTTKKNNSNSNKKDNYVRCEECGKLFVSQKHLNLHSKRTHGQIYACGQCGKNVKDLDCHFKRVHDEETLVQQEVQKNISGGPVNCTDCNKIFSSIYTFEYHKQRVHGGADQRQHECAVCGKRFAGTLSRLSRHLREAHAENRFECTVCGHFFPVRASLERHMTTVHRRTRLECPFCAVVVVHLAAHLSASHGLQSKEARGLATQLAGKSSARTHLTVDMVVSRPRSSVT